MSELEMRPLAPSLSVLIEAERNAPDPGTDVAARVLARLDAAIALGGEPNATLSEGDALSGGHVIDGVAHVAPATSTGTGIVGAFGWPALVTAFVAGGAAGALGHSVLPRTNGEAKHAPSVMVVVERADASETRDVVALSQSSSLAVHVVSNEGDARVSTMDAGTAERGASRTVVRARRSMGSNNPSPVELARERALIERIRAALARRDGTAALDAIALHVATAPGRLAEERDALEVQALAMLGRSADAHRAAHRFRGAYPASIFAPTISAALRSLFSTDGGTSSQSDERP